jgi:hypothetical protein
MIAQRHPEMVSGEPLEGQQSRSMHQVAVTEQPEAERAQLPLSASASP